MLTLDDIFGQDTAIGQLRRAIATDRLPHGLIFSGPVGVGKGTTAAALSAWLLCEKPNGYLNCGKCESCQLFQAGSHPDYHVITKELIRYHDKTGKSKGIDLSINVIRPEVVEKAAMKPSLGRGKAFVIEQAELMNSAAQNAMLKTLEEPAGRALIILLTDQIGYLLPTIRSRCQVLSFAALEDRTVLAELARRGIASADAQDAVRFAAGSLGQSLRWIEDQVIEPAKQLARLLDEVFAGKPAADLPDWFKAAGEAYAQKQMQRDELGSKDQANRQGLALFLKLASEHVRQKLTSQSEPDELEQTCAAIEAIAQAEQYLDANVNIPLIFQQLAVAIEK